MENQFKTLKDITGCDKLVIVLQRGDEGHSEIKKMLTVLHLRYERHFRIKKKTNCPSSLI